METDKAVNSSDDPILAALAIPCSERTNQDLVPIIDFVQGLKIFSSFASHPETVIQIASKLELQQFYNGSYIFQEGSPGYHFYIILDGEVSIVKKKRILALVDVTTETLTLVKLGCGQYFGENALQSKEGLRTASALATKKTKLLLLHVDDYQEILSEYKNTLKVLMRKTLSSSTCIFRFWESSILDQLASYAIVRNYSINTEIIKTGSRINSLMIVKTGIVKVVKAVSRESVSLSYRKAQTKIKKSDIIVVNTKTLKSKEEDSSASAGRSSGFLTADLKSSPKKKSGMRSLGITSADSSFSSSAVTGSHSPTPPGYWLLSGQADEAHRVEKVIDLGIEGDDRRPPTSGGIKHTHDTERGKADAADQASADQLEFTVAVLLSGSVVGELSVLDPEQLSPCTFVSSTAVEVYCFDSETLLRLGILANERIMSILRDDWKFRNPPQEEIRKQLAHKYEQEAYKRRALLKLPNIHKNKR